MLPRGFDQPLQIWKPRESECRQLIRETLSWHCKSKIPDHDGPD